MKPFRLRIIGLPVDRWVNGYDGKQGRFILGDDKQAAVVYEADHPYEWSGQTERVYLSEAKATERARQASLFPFGGEQ